MRQLQYSIGANVILAVLPVEQKKKKRLSAVANSQFSSLMYRSTMQADSSFLPNERVGHLISSMTNAIYSTEVMRVLSVRIGY